MVDHRRRAPLHRRWLHLDRLRLSRRADALSAIPKHLLAVRGARYLRLSQRQLLLLPSLVATPSTAGPFVAALDLAEPRRAADRSLGPWQYGDRKSVV